MTEEAKALFILPHYDFYDDEYFELKKLLEEKGIRTEVCSTHASEAQGRFRKLVEPEFLLQDVESEDYDVFVFVGGEGASELHHDVDIQNLVNEICTERKLIILFDEAVPILYYANVIDGRKVTAPEHLKIELEEGGAYYTGKGIQKDGEVITAFDHRSVSDVAKEIFKSLKIEQKANDDL